MGASVGMSGGLTKSPHPGNQARVVSTIGDSTFYHAGIPALINAVHTRAPVVLVILDNGQTAMTGGQPTPADNYLADGSPAKPIEMERLIRGCGVDFLEVVDPYDYEKLQDSLQRAKTYTYDEGNGVSVVIARRACVRSSDASTLSGRFQVDENCDRCMTCINELECPAMRFVREKKRVEIDADLCAGCGFCVHICPAHAIAPRGA
jgi:indolepyruvate ferredoxin oxidoreductase alpha subunit